MRDLTERQWPQLQSILPSQKPEVERPNEDHRRIINGILWVNRTGATWRDVPERYGPWSTVASRFYRWRKAGIWHQILERLQQQADVAGSLDWEMH
ncbi:IS5 family transposase [Kovacikia minuta]|uniref:IS5 family transposase n=1 Tax=Kovacikia minuta TaxID=2931930 RepID=UPI0036F2AC9D